jgi:hypothetical protein
VGASEPVFRSPQQGGIDLEVSQLAELAPPVPTGEVPIDPIGPPSLVAQAESEKATPSPTTVQVQSLRSSMITPRPERKNNRSDAGRPPKSERRSIGIRLRNDDAVVGMQLVASIDQRNTATISVSRCLHRVGVATGSLD